MGTTFPPVCTNFVMGYLEENSYRRVEKKNGSDFKKHINGYFDACFPIWTKAAVILEEFIFLLNTLQPTLKFSK